MEWSCTRCGQSAIADDWMLLFSMGWRVSPSGDRRCPICVRNERERATHTAWARSAGAAVRGTRAS
jgi:hypothetical protein